MGEGAIVLWDVVEEHLDEAEFLWTQWERCLVSPSFTLAEVEAREEERLLANVDGLVCGGEAARRRVLSPALDEGDPGRCAAAAFALLAAGHPSAAEPVLRALREGGSQPRVAAERALGLAEAPWIDDALRAVLDDAPPAGRAAALSAMAFRRVSPGAALSGLRVGDDAALLAAAFRGAAAWRDAVPRGLVIEGLAATSAAMRDEAIVAGLSLGIPEAWAACRKLARHADATTFTGDEPLPLLLAATLGDARDVEALANAAAPALRRAAVWALGYSGRVAAAETCVRLLGDPEVGKLAGEAFAAITGLPVGEHVLARGEEERDEPIPFAEEKLDDDLVPTPADALPLLDRGTVEAWWAGQRPRFERGRRYLFGVLWGRESVLAALAHGPMRRRRALAVEVAIRTQGRVQVETRAFSARQWAEVAAADGIRARELDRPFE